MRKIIFASGNKGKVEEIKHLFEGSVFEIVSLYELGDVPDIEETGETFFDNALIKAKHIYDIHKMPCIADDSGLSVEQLNGRPGVYSARYAGENCTYDDNNRKVISELKGLPAPHKAKFISCAVYYDGNNTIDCYGELKGEIIEEARGKQGFGYDPIFVPLGESRTVAEMTLDEKNSISHRGQSFKELKEILVSKF